MSITKNRKILFYIMGIGILAVVFYVMVSAASYSFYNTDDFSMASSYLESFSQNSNHLINSLRLATTDWFSWGGTYTAIFLIELLNPLLGYGLLQMRIVMMLVMGLFFSSTIYFIFNYYKIKGLDSELSFFLVLSFIWTFLNYKTWPEALFWFTGAMDYSVPLGCFVVAYTFVQKWINSNKNVYYWLSIPLVFIAAGGSQAIAIGISALFHSVIFKYYCNNKVNIKKIFQLTVFLIMPLLNILAPGNFTRQQGYGNIHLLQGILYALRVFVVETERLFKDTGFFLILNIIIGISFYRASIKSEVKVYDVLKWWVASLAVSFLACLGYDSPFLPNRTLFVFDFFLLVGYIDFAVLTGISLKKYCSEKYSEERTVLAFCAVGVIIASLQSYRIEDGYIYKLGKSLYKGEIQGYYNEINEIFDDIENSVENTVHIENLPEPIDGFVELWVAEDESDYKYLGNLEMAMYYEKDKIILKK